VNERSKRNLTDGIFALLSVAVSLQLVAILARSYRAGRLVLGFTTEQMVGWGIGTVLTLSIILLTRWRQRREAVRRARRIEGGDAADAVAAANNIAPGTTVYLRPFEVDSGGRPGILPTMHEQDLAHVMRKRGPFVAIGNPREHRVAIGAERIYFDDEVWKDAAEVLIREAHRVILAVGDTPHLVWEVRQALKRRDPRSLLLFLPPIYAWGGYVVRADEKAYARFRQSTVELFPRPLPQRVGKAMFIAFGADWEPLPVARSMTRRAVAQLFSHALDQSA